MEGSDAYTGSVLVEDDEIIAITLTVRDVPDEKAHLLHKAAMIEATGVVTGDGKQCETFPRPKAMPLDFVMEMSCNWANDVVIGNGGLAQRSPSKSPAPSAASSEIVLSRNAHVADKHLDDSSGSGDDQIQFLGSVDADGKDHVNRVLAMSVTSKYTADSQSDRSSYQTRRL